MKTSCIGGFTRYHSTTLISVRLFVQGTFFLQRMTTMLSAADDSLVRAHSGHSKGTRAGETVLSE